MKKTNTKKVNRINKETTSLRRLAALPHIPAKQDVSGKKSKLEKTLSPLRIGLNLKLNYPFILIHPEKKGYGFKVFWGEDYNLEIVGSSSKTHKTKKACITEIKKLKDFWGRYPFVQPPPLNPGINYYSKSFQLCGNSSAILLMG